MSIRGARMLVAGACSPLGQRVVEAFLALGAHVIAADALRTRLEALRAELRQHERLWVAECDFADARAAHALLADVVRDEPLDCAVAALGADRRRCEVFVRAVLATPAPARRGRIVLASASAQAPPPPALAALLAEAAPDAERRGVALCGVALDLEQPAALARVVALADPELPAAAGWIER
jgi:NAD(P)-dependent dehydrogenase (short-subunit alcohol dehydrogenase family)